jgi:hypothetical protein
MTETQVSAVPKVHPASREILPDDPMEMHGFEVPGDADLMLRMIVEEYARIGWGLDDMMRLARDPNYTGFYGLSQAHGEMELRRRIAEILARCGVIRVTATETEPMSEQLVQISLPVLRETSPCPWSTTGKLAAK